MPEYEAVAQAQAPALGVAGLLAVASAIGAGARRFWYGTPLEGEYLVVVVLLGALAAQASGAIAAARRAWPWLALLGLAAALRAAGAPPDTLPTTSSPPPAVAPLVVGRATPEHRQVERRDRATWSLVRPISPNDDCAPSTSLQTVSGALSPGDTVAVLPTAMAPRRARSRDFPSVERPLPRRPLADEILRLRSAQPASGKPPGLPWSAPIRSLRSAGVHQLAELPDATTSGLLTALLFGETSRLPRGTADLFTRTGTRHMLALSGLHVGLLGVLIALPLARGLCALAHGLAALLGRRWKPSPAFATAAIALAFVPLAGQGAPAARAALALALASLAPSLGRRPIAMNLLGMAMIVEVAAAPLAALQAGVQLSYLASAALMICAAPASRAAMGWLPGAGIVRPTWPSGRRRSPWLRLAAQRSIQVVVISLSTSLVASIATLPIVWTRFGEFSAIGLIATPLAFPPLVVLVAGGWLWLALSSVPFAGWLSLPTDTLRHGLDAAANSMISLLHWADMTPWSPLPLPMRSVLWVSLAAWACLFGMQRQTAHRRTALRVGVALFGLALFPGTQAHSAGHGTGDGPFQPQQRATALEAHVLDVGNGTAVVLRAPGEPTWIFDAGSRDRVSVARSGVAPLLRSLDVGRLRVSLSHDDTDHAGALPWIVRRWNTDLWSGPSPSPVEPRSIHRNPLAGLRHVPQRAGCFRITEPGAALQIRVIHGGDFGSNEGSGTLDVRWTPPPSDPSSGTVSEPFRIVLSGDAEGHGLAAMLYQRGAEPAALEPGPVDALLLPHHGSASTHLTWLLDHLQPAEVWVSGSELPVDLGELVRRGIPVRATADVGGFMWQAAPMAP